MLVQTMSVQLSSAQLCAAAQLTASRTVAIHTTRIVLGCGCPSLMVNEYTDTRVEKCIILIQNSSAIWNKKYIQFLNKNFRLKAWEEIVDNYFCLCNSIHIINNCDFFDVHLGNESIQT